MPQLLNASILVVATLVVGGFFVAWQQLLVRWRKNEAWIPFTPRRPVPWGLLDFLVCFALLFFVVQVLIFLADRLWHVSIAADDAPESLFTRILLSQMAQLIAMMFGIGAILVRSRSSLEELGVSEEHIGTDLLHGFVAFLALALPTYLLQGLLTQFWPSEHPLIVTLESNPQPQYLLIAMFAAVIGAPITEEFVFRMLLQGWLEKLFHPVFRARPNSFTSLLLGETRDPLAPREPTSPTTPPLDAELAVPVDGSSWEETSFPTNIHPSHNTTIQYFNHPTTATLTIGVSSLLFALAHWSHGPDWLPLIVYSTGLGYLYHRTHRLLPSIVAHMLLNGTSMLALCIKLYAQ